MSLYVKGAAMYCQNRRFWAFLSAKTNTTVDSADTAKVRLCELCGITSRRELAKNYAARGMYVSLVAEFNKFIKSGACR